MSEKIELTRSDLFALLNSANWAATAAAVVIDRARTRQRLAAGLGDSANQTALSANRSDIAGFAEALCATPFDRTTLVPIFRPPLVVPIFVPVPVPPHGQNGLSGADLLFAAAQFDGAGCISDLPGDEALWPEFSAAAHRLFAAGLIRPMAKHTNAVPTDKHTNAVPGAVHSGAVAGAVHSGAIAGGGHVIAVPGAKHTDSHPAVASDQPPA